jgi:hypothetical protein
MPYHESVKRKKIIFSKPFTSRIFMSVKLIQENKKKARIFDVVRAHIVRKL